MGLESATYINDLVSTNPTASDLKSQGDDQIRLNKSTSKNTFPGFTGAVMVGGVFSGTAAAHVLTPATALPSYTAQTFFTYTPTLVNTGACTVNVSGLGAKSIKTVDGSDPTAGDIPANKSLLLQYDGTNMILMAGGSYVARTGNSTITGNITLTGNQTISGTLAVTGALTGTSMDAKGDVAGETWSGTQNFTGATITAATQTTGDSTTKVATTEFVANQVLTATLPAQAGNAGKYLQTDGALASWQNLSANGGATETRTGSNVTLTSASNRVQAISTTVASLTVSLPSATTMALIMGSPVFVIINTGLFSYRVIDNAGSTIAIVGSGQAVAISLYDSSTAAGIWGAHNISKDTSPLGRFHVGAQTAVSAQAVNNSDGRIAICALSADKFLLAYSDTTAGLGRVLVVDLTATVPSYGTPLSFLASAVPTFLSITAMSSTQAILCYMNGSTSEAKTINVSGSTCTAGAAHDYAGAAVNYNRVDRASATTAMVTYNTTGNNYAVKLLTVSGTSITSGTAGAIRSGVATSSRASTVLSATRGGILYVLDSALTTLRSATIDLSVNPPTVNGDAITSITSTPTLTTLTGLTENNNAIATYLTSTTTKAFPLNFGASSIVEGVGSTIFTAASPAGSSTVLINGNTVGWATNTANTAPFMRLSIDQTSAVNANTMVKFTNPELVTISNLGTSLTFAVSTSGKALWGFRNSSTTFANTVTQEITG